MPAASLRAAVHAGAAFEVNGVILAADTGLVPHDDPKVLDLAREVVRRRLRRT